MSIKDRLVKRIFDIVISALGLIVSAPVIAIAFLVAMYETRSNGFFLQKRVGKGGAIFNVIKIKTMKQIEGIDTTITSSNDMRITRSGVFFRKSKTDELPQLWNVLIGEMSLVGPRPDVPGYADNLEGSDRLVLSIRPGITGPASFKYKNEEALLAEQKDPIKYNDQVIWPDKVRINRDYIESYTFKKDLYYIWKTIVG
jgi:lipopolysaccharide/colanic/teichoic acid biosynthesis glycosyltransferase